MRIAPAGAGVSGLAAPHALAREPEMHHVDTGFIAFNDGHYPNFSRRLAAHTTTWVPARG